MPHAIVPEVSLHERNSAAVDAAAVIDALHFGLAVLDSRAYILSANPAFLSLAGLEQAQGLHMCDALFPGGGQEELRASGMRHGLRLDLFLATPGRDTTRVRLTITRLSDSAQEAYLASLEDITQDRGSLARLEDDVVSRQALMENLPCPVYLKDPAGAFIGCNRAFEEFLGLSRAEIIGRSSEEVSPGDLADLSRDKDNELFANPGSQSYEACVRYADGSFHAVVFSKATFPGPNGAVAGLVGLMLDVTELRRTEEKLRSITSELETQVERRTAHLLAVNTKLKAEITERKIAVAALAKAEQKFRSIFENAMEGIYQSTPEGRFINANPALARIFGYESPEHLIREITDASSMYADPDRRTEFMRLMHKDGLVSGLESQIRRRDGALIWISENARAVRDKDGNISFYEGTLEDVTERRLAQDELARRSFYDTLTGLANKALFMDRLTQVMTRARRSRDYRYAVLFLDLDRFKVVNESLGHSRGDKLLRNIARKLTLELRGNDSVARFGGDEFAVLLDDLTAPRQAINVAKRIREALSEPVTIDEHQVFTSASIGVVLGSEHDTSAEQILRDVDIAMNRAKKAGKSQFKIFSSQMHAQAMRLLNLEGDLRRALDRGEFLLHYQPIVSLADGRLTGFEALVRWLHPQKGLIPPSDFISLAEETGLILPLGSWVLDQACHQLARWNDKNPERGLTMAVNLSATQINHANLVDQVERTLRKTGLPPQSLKLEITESVVMQNAEAASSLLKQLRDLSVKLSIDDFGTGYSSLSYLNRFPVDTLKIDRSFVSGMADQAENLGIVQSVVSLAHTLGMDVVAEGVETPEQMDSLKGLDCEFAQGYFFSRPVDVANACVLLDTRAAW
jgi:diguanylate cyclase (GGDEF)-like protein/PAS domain S-box-containing protein